jgi:hypothetical protein
MTANVHSLKDGGGRGLDDGFDDGVTVIGGVGGGVITGEVSVDQGVEIIHGDVG